MQNQLHRLSRTSVMAIAAMTLILGAIVGSSTPASATTTRGVQATPYNNGSHPWSTDGCSVVPDWGPSWVGGAYFDFNHACIHHDGCYRQHWADRGTCDKWFLNDMYASCNAIHPAWRPGQRASCYNQAVIYYNGVRAFGNSAYVAWTYTARLA